MKKIIVNIIQVIMIILVSLIVMTKDVRATELKTELEIIQNASETKYLENDQGNISKTIVDSNKDSGEVTIELKLENKPKVEEEQNKSEVLFVIDNSPSMDFVTSTGKTRKEIVLNSASKLISSIYENYENVNVGIIEFNGKDASKYDATLIQRATQNKEMVLSKINEQLDRKTVSGTNIEAGLLKAETSFDKDIKNKIVILLTDGIPNVDISGNNGTDDVKNEINKKIALNTKNRILELKQEGIYTIAMLTGLSESDGNTDKNGNVFDRTNTIEEELAASEEIFGTKENPITDRYYIATNVEIDKVISEDMFEDVSTKVQNPINSVKVVDYFPKDITDNFDFSYVENPNIGTVSDTIDKENNTIEWNVGELKGNQVASLKYKLKIRDMKNTALLNKTIDTNQKVVLTYKDRDLKDYTIILSSSPKIQLSEIKENINKDNTIANKIFPNTGLGAKIIICIIPVVLLSIIMYKKYKGYKDIK